jgi:hypothetical protein
VAIVLYGMRVKPATARHRVWTAVMALMRVLPIWTPWGPKVPLRVLPALPEIPPGIIQTSLTVPPAVSMPEAVLLGIYLLGLCPCSLRLRGYRFLIGLSSLMGSQLLRYAVKSCSSLLSRFCAIGS